MDQQIFEMLAETIRGRIAEHENLHIMRPSYEEIREISEGILKSFESARQTQCELADKQRLLKLITDNYDVQVGEPLVTISNPDRNRWLDAKKHEIDWKHWRAYRKMLEMQGRSKIVIDRNEEAIDAALDLSEDPTREGEWARKGLIMGNVQSGKTQNFLGLINKSIDAGYRTIIVLGGHQNELRMQTQERVDEGVLGWPSRHLIDITQHTNSIGIGRYFNIKGRMPIGSATTTLGDFNKAFANKCGIHLDQPTPIIFTIKKNTSILKTLIKWIEDTHDSNPQGETRLNNPMLLIDDEADYASINTKHHKDEVTATNELIRKLLSLFNRRSYVAYTATPFANIFIDPSDASNDEEDDLFPSDFMIKLPVPDNYMGQDAFFSHEVLTEDLDSSSPLVEIDDHKPLYALKSKDEIYDLPSSLKDAVRAFLIVVAVRTVRGEINSHNTMLVNISHLKQHQNSLETLIGSYKEELVNDIASYGQLSQSLALSNKSIRDIKETFFDRFNIKESFTEILEVLSGVQRRSIKVWAINQSGNLRDRHTLNYSTYKKIGLNVIVIGGHKLSRGLTLEGLSISYFARNSKAYDTLMQMCRWFGYRPGYTDLCKVFLPEESIEWYGFISSTIRDLYGELELMALREDRPSDFGLKVKMHPGAMIVTAKNKIGLATARLYHQDLWGQVQRRYRFYGDRHSNNKNLKYVSLFLQDLFTSNSENITTDQNGLTLVSNVDYHTIIEFIENVYLPEDNSGNQVLVKQLQAMSKKDFPLPKVMLFNQANTTTPKWEGDLSAEDKEFINKPYNVAGRDITLAKRAMIFDGLVYKTPNTNLGNKDDEKHFLTLDQRNKVVALGDRKDPIDQDYIAADGRDFAGLKIYYFAVSKKRHKNDESTVVLAHGREPTVGYSISFPRPENMHDMSHDEVKELMESTKHAYLLNKVHTDNPELAEQDDHEEI